jgi:hypothetical protein
MADVLNARTLSRGRAPLTIRFWPLTKADRSLARYSAALATSLIVPFDIVTSASDRLLGRPTRGAAIQRATRQADA